MRLLRVGRDSREDRGQAGGYLLRSYGLRGFRVVEPSVRGVVAVGDTRRRCRARVAAEERARERLVGELRVDRVNGDPYIDEDEIRRAHTRKALGEKAREDVVVCGIALHDSGVERRTTGERRHSRGHRGARARAAEDEDVRRLGKLVEQLELREAVAEVGAARGIGVRERDRQRRSGHGEQQHESKAENRTHLAASIGSYALAL